MFWHRQIDRYGLLLGRAINGFRTALTAQDSALLRRFAFLALAGLLITCTTEKTIVNPSPPPVDLTPPDVGWESPEGGATLRDTVTLKVRVYDESGVDSVHLLKDGALITAIFPPYASRGGVRGGAAEYLWNTRADSDGVHLLSAVAWDSAGNEGQSQALLVKVNNNAEPPVEDRTPPVIEWISPEPGSALEGVVDLNFRVIDNVAVDSARITVAGQNSSSWLLVGDSIDFQVTWNTYEAEDGQYLVDVRAWDSSGNMGVGNLISLRVWNNRPRVIWVPDDYETIQGAIWASKDGDTIRVGSGTYREPSITFGRKNLWLESSDGPEVTIIDADSVGGGVGIYGEQDTSTCIRGFTIRNSLGIGIYIGGQFTSARIVNNITISHDISSIRLASQNHCIVRNNIFSTAEEGAELFISYGVFENNIVIHSWQYALWNVSAWDINPIVPDYDLIWDYGQLMNSPEFDLGANNVIDADPRFIQNGFQLQEDSPCIDAGNPDILDRDGSISDIGVYGGPLSYPPP